MISTLGLVLALIGVYFGPYRDPDVIEGSPQFYISAGAAGIGLGIFIVGFFL